MNQQCYLGHTAIADLREKLIQLHVQRIFLVRGNHSYTACGAEATLSPVFSELGITMVEYRGFSVNPKMEEATIGVDLFMTSNADCILAIGGGSTMDMAKLIHHYAAQRGIIVPLMAMPTTAGTGAEATHFAVVYINGKKKSIEADDILPDYAFVYPPFTYTNDAYLTACTGFDALAQAFEAYWNKNATVESTQYALKAISLLLHQLPECVNRPTNLLRDEIIEGAYWAGRAINITKTTAPHAFSYAFTSQCGYPHGHAVALTFPFFAELNLGKKGLYKYFSEYVQKIGLGYNGTKGYDLDSILHEVNLQRLSNNPVDVTDSTIMHIKNSLNSQQ